jgi:hypothetical protein
MKSASEAPASISDPLYDLVGTLYRALKQAAAARRHAEDARRGGDLELAGFFDELQEQSLDLAERCKTLLTARLGRDEGRSPQEKVQEASEESFPASDAPAY